MTKKGKILTITASFLLAALFAVSFYAANDIYPGSSKTILIYDETQQYSAIWESVRYIFSGDANVLFNWNMNLGGNNLANLFYYLGSPLNLIIAIAPLKAMPDVVYILTIFKFAMASCAFSFFVLFGRKEVIKAPFVVLFSFTYAFMSYTVMYSMCLMWLDGVIMLPLVLTGLQRLIETGKKGSFIASLTVLFWINYYTGYMIAVFSFIYLVWEFIRLDGKFKDFVKTFKSYAFSGIASALLSAPVLCISVFALAGGKGQEETTKIFTTTGNLFEQLKKFFICQYDSITNYGTASLYIGTGCLVLIALFFAFNKNKRLGVCTLAMLVFFILSLWLKPLYIAWHGFKNPVCFPGRFSFTFCCFNILIAIEGFKLTERVLTESKNPYVQLLKKYLVPVFFAFTFGELWMNASYILINLNIECTYKSRYDFEAQLKLIDKSEEMIDDNSFYRLSVDKSFGSDDGMLFGYNGITSYTSLYNYDLLEMWECLGAEKRSYVMMEKGMSPFLRDIIFNRYHISKGECNLYGFDRLYGETNFYLYENKDICPVGFMLSGDGNSIEKSENVFDNNNRFFNSFTGMENLYISASVEEKECIIDDYEYSKTITVTPEANGILYLYFTGEDLEENSEKSRLRYEEAKNTGNIITERDVCEIYLKDSLIESMDSPVSTYIVTLCEAVQGETVEAVIKSNYDFGKLYAATLCEDNLKEALSTLNSSGIEMTDKKGTILSGNISAEKSGTLFLSIPYSDGISVFVDGEKAEPIKICDCFLGVYIDEGEHEISVKYCPKGLKSGMLIMLLGILSFTLDQIIKRRKSEKTNPGEI